VNSDAGERHVYHVYAVRVPDRETVRQGMIDAQIGVGIHYPIPVHLQPAFKELGYKPGDFPVTEAISNETLSLPIYPELGEADINTVVADLRRILG
jgi:dTDP-4-amino-4,6-dideoxygalactose transaminase